MKPRTPFSPFAVCARPLPRTAWQCRNNAPSFATWRSMALQGSFVRAASTATATKRATKPAPVPAKRPSNATASSVPAKRPSPPTSLSPAAASTALNPPIETYPPALSVPDRKPNQNKLAWLYHCGKAYLTFYKSGIKNIRASSKLAKVARAKAAASPDRDDALSRAEWQLTRRSRADMVRLPAFGLLMLVFGEWTPLIVLYLTPVIPEACRIPKQVERAQRKTEAKRAVRFERAARDAARLEQRGSDEGMRVDVRRFDARQAQAVRDALGERGARVGHFSLLLLSARFDAHPKVLDALFVTPPRWWLQWRLRKKMEYLVRDDALVARDGGWGGLRREEVVRACEERGVDVREKSEGELRKVLAAWGSAS